MTIAIGIDIGGTKTAIGLIDEQGQLLAKQALPTDLGVSPPQMVARIAAGIQEMIDTSGILSSELIGIGIGAPGPLDTRSGILDCPPNLPGWQGFALVEALRRHFDLPVRMENDATAAALAEKWLGAAQGSEHFAFVTISTGIGAGLYAHGRLLTGSSGNAGDAGHIVIDPAAGRCACGQLGCWEWVASGTAIARQATELRGRATTAKEAFALAAAGDAVMQPLVERVYRYIGMGCVSLINLLDPELIVLGGGVAQSGAPLFAAVSAYVAAHALGPRGRRTAIVPAELKTEAGLIGAAALVHVPY